MAAVARRYALLLRGVNVGTKNSLPMAELRTMLADLGCTDVVTYVQSGNAVLRTTRAAADLTSGLEDALRRFMGRPIATVLRTPRELATVVKENPFAKVATNPAYLCVTFLSQRPTKPELAPLFARSWAPDQLEVRGTHLYSWHPTGQGKSPLAAALAKLPLRGAVTTRNWNTVLRLLTMLNEQ